MKEEVIQKLVKRIVKGDWRSTSKTKTWNQPPHKAVAVNRRRTNFQRTAYSATSNPTEESSHATTQLWTLGQDQDQTAIDREILAPFFDQYD